MTMIRSVLVSQDRRSKREAAVGGSNALRRQELVSPDGFHGSSLGKLLFARSLIRLSRWTLHQKAVLV